MSIVINTPTSNIGRALAARLLDAGERITVLSRDKKKVDELLRRGARVVEGSFEEPALLAEALEGAGALFWLTPPPARSDYYAWAIKCAKQAAVAAKKAGVRRAVVISSAGAHTGPGTGAVGPAREMENDFEAALPAVVSLRPGIFMENFLLSTDMIAKAGQIFTPLPAGKRWPLVATADIAAKAACWLLDRGWSGHHRVGVHGPKDLSTDEAAAIISSALGEPVKCVETTIDQARGALTGMGMPDFIVEIIIEMYVAFREGRLDQAEPRTPDTTTPTTLAEFARTTLVPAIHNVSSAAARS
ncbi:MAG TPA: NAD(P)H-binding protein [Methylomirabilota bacterium]|nr:NAD(P)H-binding protein [Methylomirabilota bacterium]